MAGQKPYHIPPGTPFNEIVVPTIDNVRHTFLLDLLLSTGYHFLRLSLTFSYLFLTHQFKLQVRKTKLPIPSKSHYSVRLLCHYAKLILSLEFGCTIGDYVFSDRLIDQQMLVLELKERFKVEPSDLYKTENLLKVHMFKYVQVTY